MGNCATVQSNRLQQKPSGIEAQQIPSIQHNKKFKFQTTISNIVLHGTRKSIDIYFQIEGKAQITLASKPSEVKEQIKVHLSIFKVEMSYEQLTTKSLLVALMEDKKRIDSLKINMLRIVTGPSKFKFTFDSQLSVFFTLKITQWIDFQIEATKTMLYLQNEYPGDRICFTLMYYSPKNDQKKLQTKPSNTYEVPILSKSFKNKKEEQEDSATNSKNKQFQTSIRISRCQGLMGWKVGQSSMPRLKLKLLQSSLGSSTLSICFWKVFSQGAKEVMNKFGKVTINFNKILQLNRSSPHCNNYKVNEGEEYREFSMEGHVLADQTNMGNCQLEFIVRNQQYFKQKLNSIQTQKGVVAVGLEEEGINSVSFGDLSLRIKKLSSKLLTLKIQCQLIEKRANAKHEIKKLLGQLSEELRVSSTTLDQISSLLQRQEDLLIILKVAIIFLQEEDDVFTQQGWELAATVVRRSELSLQNLGFQGLSEQKKQRKGKKIWQQKIQVGLQYQRKMYTLLSLCLNSIVYQKQFNSDTSISSQRFKAYCYFRIPIFNRKLLEAIEGSNQQDFRDFISEEKGIGESEGRRQIIQLFAWKELFYDYLRQYSISQEHNQELKQLLENSRWFFELKKKKNTYLHFMKEFYQQIRSIQTHTPCHYSYFKGYNKMTVSLLCEMKYRPLYKYSALFVHTTSLLLINSRLWEPILVILFQKTNLNIPNNCLKLIQVLQLYMKFIANEHKFITTTFCGSYFFRGLKILLQNQIPQVVTGAIQLLFGVYQQLECEIRVAIALYFMGSAFNRLFFHWSPFVRHSFHSFFIFKICQDQPIFQVQAGKVKDQYHQILHWITNTEQISLSHQQMCLSFDKNIHLKLKNRIQERKLKSVKKNNDENSSNETIEKQRKSLILFNFEAKAQKEKQGLQRTTDHDQESESLVDLTDINLEKKYTFHQTVKYNNCFRQPEFNLSELTQKQLQIAKMAINELKNLSDSIANHYSLHKCLPSANIGIDLRLDEDDISPHSHSINL